MVGDPPESVQDPTWSWLDFILKIDFTCIALTTYLFGFLSNVSQYLLKYDDPVRYKRQTLYGLFYGYLLCLTTIYAYGFIHRSIRSGAAKSKKD